MEKLSHEVSEEKPLDAEFELALKRDLDERKEKLVKNIGRIGRIVYLSAMAGWAGLIMSNIASFKNEFKDKTFEKTDGQTTTWSHSDKTTEHLLNTFSGKENFTIEEQNYIAQQLTLAWCAQNNIKPPANINEMNTEDIKNFCNSFPEIGLVSASFEAKTHYEYLKSLLLSEPYFMPNLYQELWKKEKKCGSPYVRLMGKDDSTALKSPHVNNFQYRRSYYMPGSNTMYLAPESFHFDLFRSYVSELAHAEQFVEKPITSMATTYRDHTLAKIRTLLNNTSYTEEQNKEYNKPGTTEYDAHTIREPKIRSEIENAYGKDNFEKFEKNEKKDYVTEE